MLLTSKTLTKTLLLLCLFPFSVWAQTEAPSNTALRTDWLEENRAKVWLSGEAQYASNAFTLGKIGEVFTGGVIDDALMDNLAENAEYLSHIFYRDQLDFSYRKRLNEKYALTIGLRQENFASAAIPRAAFQLAAYGNGPYKGTKMEFDNASLNYFAISGIDIGFLKSIETRQGAINISLNAGLLQGQNLVNMRSQTSSLYTEENAEYLDLIYDFEYSYYDAPAAFSGLGFDLGFSVLYQYEERFQFKTWVEGLGNMYWGGDNFNSGSASGELRYEGQYFAIDGLSSISSENELNAELDSLTDVLLASERDNYTLNLPYTAGFSVCTYIGTKESLTIGAHLVSGIYYLPVVSASFRHFFNDALYASVNYNSGPFGGHGIGLEAGYSSKKFSLKAKSNGLLRIIGTQTPLTVGRVQLSYFI